MDTSAQQNAQHAAELLKKAHKITEYGNKIQQIAKPKEEKPKFNVQNHGHTRNPEVEDIIHDMLGKLPPDFKKRIQKVPFYYAKGSHMTPVKTQVGEKPLTYLSYNPSHRGQEQQVQIRNKLAKSLVDHILNPTATISLHDTKRFDKGPAARIEMYKKILHAALQREGNLHENVEDIISKINPKYFPANGPFKRNSLFDLHNKIREAHAKA